MTLKPFVLGLSLFVASAFTLSEAAFAQDAASQTTKKKKKKKKKKQDGASSATAPGSLAIDTSMPVTATAAPADPDDLGIIPLDVEHMLFDAKSIQDVIKHHMPQIQSCYEKALATTGQRIEGKVMMGFTIDVTGTVQDARVIKKKSEVTDERVTDCVLLRLKRLVFPKPPDNRRYPIEFPFNLTVKK